MAGKNKGIHMVTFILLVVGGINWLLVGLIGWDVGRLFGGMDALVSRVIYVLVGLSALYELATHKANCKACGGNGMKSGGSGSMTKDSSHSSGDGSSGSMGGSSSMGSSDSMGGSDQGGM